jgi:pilus assembly protein CpaE
MAEKILIVDDDLETLRLVGLMLQRQGYQIVAANNGNQGIAVAKKEKPDLIVLDVMMPDMDGYSVTKILRSDPILADIPILMFTAKSQVDDKVAGYEAGVDDYLTKPVHPVELVAHIKALLSRRKSRTSPLEPIRKGHIIGVISGKGGLGVSSVTLNLGIALFDKTNADIICAEMRPGSGTWGMELGFAETQGLDTILLKKPEEITGSLIEDNLIRTTYGIRLLLASSRISDMQMDTKAIQAETLVQKLDGLSQITFLDLGTGCSSVLEHIVKFCNEMIVVTESQPVAIQKTRILIDELEKRGFGKSKLLNVLIYNRVRADIQLSQPQVQEKLGHSPILVIPPAPEQAYQAATHFQPLIKVQAESLVSQQFGRLAEHFVNRIKK